MTAETFNTYRQGKIHVQRTRCATCIFRPGNLMRLNDGRVEQMVADADGDGTAITCHDTLDRADQAVCRGYFDRHNSSTLQIAERVGAIEFDPPPN